MAKTNSKPGVYIEEMDAFSTSILSIPTAVPAFIGYTEKAERGTKTLTGVPTKIISFKEFEEFFGGSPLTKVILEEDPQKTDSHIPKVEASSHFFLHASMKLFYSNGGGDCYIVSVGDYHQVKNKEALIEGIKTLEKFLEPTMLVVPDAVLLEEATSCYEVQKSMLQHCGEVMRNRVAILDIYNGYLIPNEENQAMDTITNFREGIGTRSLEFGAAYYPWLNTNVVSVQEISSANIKHKNKLVELLKAEFLIEGDAADQITQNQEIQEQIDLLGIEERESLTEEEVFAIRVAEFAVKAVSPLYNKLMDEIKSAISLLPPSGGIAGIISYVDNTMGVGRSPANVGLNEVISPSITISSKEQEDLNIPLDGKAINVIRSFPGKGVLVWGARTLMGNSQDWRYISVRRSMIMIEQSIKIATGVYIFEPNTQSTWQDVKSTISSFLYNQWQNGILAGATPEDAFSINVGLGETMTPVDILEGLMKIEIKVAVVRPAEFINISIVHQMPTS